MFFSTRHSATPRMLSLIGLSLISIVLVLMLLVGCSSGTPSTTAAPKPATSLPPSTAAPTTNNPPAGTSVAPSVTTPPKPTASPAPPSTTASSPSVTPRTSYNPKEVLLSSTTSVRDSGLMDKLIPLFQQKYPYFVTPVYVGSGAAIALGNTGNADVMVVHQPSGEKAFMDSGNGIDRRLIMHNDFVVLGPSSDPAKIKGSATAVDAFKAIIATAATNKQVTFYSRGDNSGTDAKDKELFKAAGLTVKDKDPGNPSWYIEATGGMGPVLTITEQNQGYTLSDRGTYLAYKSKITLQVLFEGDPALLNTYHVIRVNPEKFPGIINVDGAKTFADFMVGKDAQDVIANFKDSNGNLLFVPDGGKTDADIGVK